ncbi:hypothetical protein DFJ77DRAFT_412453, partial [Powellomyces hirtus]
KWARLVWAFAQARHPETDLLLSTFAGRAPRGALFREELTEYDDFLEENDWDIYYWMTGAEGKIVPESVKALKIFPRWVQHSKN